MDFQLMQKVLPRIHGSSNRIRAVLTGLIDLLTGESINYDDMAYVRKTVEELEALKYPRAVKKLLFMLQRFEEDRFTSFWI